MKSEREEEMKKDGENSVINYADRGVESWKKEKQKSNPIAVKVVKFLLISVVLFKTNTSWSFNVMNGEGIKGTSSIYKKMNFLCPK